MIYKKHPNGDLYTVARGLPPPVPAGYFRDGRDCYLFHPILEDCEFYVPFKEKLSCGKLDIGIFCDLKQIVVTNGDCKKCQLKRKAHITESCMGIPGKREAKQTSQKVQI